jgi:uncharacterized secreted protein with C-terminal beta-propeller domain
MSNSRFRIVPIDLLVSVGQDTTPEGRLLGTQVSLFDVSDPAAPRRLSQQALGPRGPGGVPLANDQSSVEFDHRAFVWWSPRRLAVVPVVVHGRQPFSGAVALSIGPRADGRLLEVGRLTHAAVGVIPINRSLVVGDRLYTLSDVGVLGTTLDGFQPAGWLRFS